MSDREQRDQKTEQPTPRRQEQAREKGQLLSSADLTVGIKLLAASLVLWKLGPAVAEPLRDLFDEFITRSPEPTQQPAVLRAIASRIGLAVAQALGTFLPIVASVVLATSLTQTGFNVSFQPLAPDVSRLSWTKGWDRLFSRRSQVRAGFSILKLGLLSGVAAWILANDLPNQVRTTSLIVKSVAAWVLTMKLSVAMSLTLLAVGILDYLFQRSEHEADLRMTRQELKDDLRQTDGDPLMRARIRKLQRERSRTRMLAEVPQSTVIIRNPTHYAVALRYDRTRDAAPILLAKGQDFLALRIIEIAREHNIPIVERREMARAIFHHVEIGAEVPSQMFFAVAEVLNYVYKLRGRI
jgi:flagellar biosynthetic protein FlhB